MSGKSRVKRNNKSKNIWKKILITFFIFIVTITLTILYARFIGTSGLKIKEYKIVNSSIPDSFYGTKIVHISDVHYGMTVNEKELDNLVKKVNMLKPDIIVITGDLIDRHTILEEKEINKIISILNKMEAKISKYAIMGNHDYKIKSWNTIITNSGFINLDNTYDVIYNNGFNPILLAGVSTNSYLDKDKTSIKEKMKSIDDYISSINNSKEGNLPKYRILLLHEPDFIDNINIDDYNLILAGHSHDGQVKFPVIGATILPPNAKKYYKNYYNINGTDLYISSGVGTSTIKYRLFNRPSINLYRLTNK